MLGGPSKMLRRLRSHPLSTASCAAKSPLSKLHGDLLQCVSSTACSTRVKARTGSERSTGRFQQPAWLPALTGRCCKVSCDDGWVGMRS